jgi:hypothetical protein
MRLAATYVLCVGMALLVVGCTHRDSQPDSHSTNNPPATTDTTTPTKTSNNFTVRFDAASAIMSDASRQDAFAKLAIEAAFAGDSDVAKKSLAEIKSDAVREDSAYKCAIYLAKVGKGEDALAIAKSIASDAQREKALTKIANGDFSL